MAGKIRKTEVKVRYGKTKVRVFYKVPVKWDKEIKMFRIEMNDKLKFKDIEYWKSD